MLVKEANRRYRLELGAAILLYLGVLYGSLAIGRVRAPRLRAAAQVRLQSHLLLPLPKQANLNRALDHSGHHEPPGRLAWAGFCRQPRRACVRCHPLPARRPRCACHSPWLRAARKCEILELNHGISLRTDAAPQVMSAPND